MLFDEKGYIKPYEVIPTTLEIFRTHFVFNEHREQIFQVYLDFADILKSASEIPKVSFNSISKNMATIENNSILQDELLTRITRTVELIKMYTTGIKQAMSMEAPLYLIESKQRMKAELVAELITLMAELDVQFELKQAA